MVLKEFLVALKAPGMFCRSYGLDRKRLLKNESAPLFMTLFVKLKISQNELGKNTHKSVPLACKYMS